MVKLILIHILKIGQSRFVKLENNLNALLLCKGKLIKLFMLDYKPPDEYDSSKLISIRIYKAYIFKRLKV